jgi:L-rhamnose-H+ transport protein
MLVLFSSVAGLVMKEWKQCSSQTLRWLGTALLVLVIAILLLTYGNYLGENK